MTEDLNFKKLKSLVHEVYGVKEINMETEINKLNTVSEDNDHFIELFKTEFNVDMGTFPYYKYFEEDEFILLSLFMKFFPMTRNEKKVLTVGHLMSVIKKGKWFEIN